MDIYELEIPGVRLLKPDKLEDSRGFFSETYRKHDVVADGAEIDFVQENHSSSTAEGTIRGLHFQSPPFEQIKLVRVIRGNILDVAVDIRRRSPTYGQYVSAILNADEWNQLLVPVGFAHGFCTLAPNTEVIYKVSNYYSPEHDRGLRWNDAAIGIDWPVGPSDAQLSDKDRAWPLLDALESPFRYRLADR